MGSAFDGLKGIAFVYREGLFGSLPGAVMGLCLVLLPEKMILIFENQLNKEEERGRDSEMHLFCVLR